MRANRKLNIKRVIAAMEKANPSIRVSAKFNDAGRVYFDTRPKTEQELEMDAIIKALGAKKEKILELYNQIKDGAEPLCPTCNKVKGDGHTVCSDSFHAAPAYQSV
jgi:hypothetical protein